MPAVPVIVGANLVQPVNTIRKNTMRWPLRSCKTLVLHNQSCPKMESHQKPARGQRHSLPAETFIFASYMNLPTLLNYKKTRYYRENDQVVLFIIKVLVSIDDQPNFCHRLQRAWQVGLVRSISITFFFFL